MRLFIGVLALMPLFASAQTAYVTDTLQLGLHQASDTSDRPFRSLDSGQELEILSRTTYYANVRLPDGTLGWVKAGFLVNDKPARLIVAETRAEADKLAGELEELRGAFAAPAATIDALKQQVADLQTQLGNSDAKAVEFGEQNASLRNRQSQYKNSMPLQWVAGAVGLCLIGGFLFGLWWVDQRSRRRHGGIRIY
ncbi:MAG: TIGR04211 family SH3 domain-containing protein [Woeseiaceae bacterium]|nr:TIGR04211 family SH3 domain-containing protein [Woeseiaceae bacterium]MDX2607683.1 TIGR04211 family SH3 domain-containing protein [Woeseiaceae bacterium]